MKILYLGSGVAILGIAAAAVFLYTQWSRYLIIAGYVIANIGWAILMYGYVQRHLGASPQVAKIQAIREARALMGSASGDIMRYFAFLGAFLVLVLLLGNAGKIYLYSTMAWTIFWTIVWGVRGAPWNIERNKRWITAMERFPAGYYRFSMYVTVISSAIIFFMYFWIPWRTDFAWFTFFLAGAGVQIAVLMTSYHWYTKRSRKYVQ